MSSPETLIRRVFSKARAGGSFAGVNTEKALFAKVSKWAKPHEFLFCRAVFIGKNQNLTGHDKVHCVGIIAFCKKHIILLVINILPRRSDNFGI